MSARRSIRAGLRRALGPALALLLSAATAGAGGRIAFAEIEVVGPFEGARLDAGAAGATRVGGRLERGETRRLVVPVPQRAGGPRAEPDVAGARFLRWHADDPALAALPQALRARALPAAADVGGRVPLAALLLLAVALVAVLALRRRPIAALSAALALGLGAALASARAGGERVAVTEVLDGVLGSEVWARTTAAIGAIAFDGRAAGCELASDPASARLDIEVDLALAGRFRALSRGARLACRSAERWPPDALAPEENRLVDLMACWTREGGEWTARGPWPVGQPLPAPVDASSPPGWLLAGLPQGLRLSVGRAGAGGAWVRCSWP